MKTSHSDLHTEQESNAVVLEKLKAQFLTEDEVAGFLGMKLGAIRAIRYDGEDHPPWIKFGRRVAYPMKDFQTWLAKRPRNYPVT